jgi:hypothetical protein
VRLRFISGQHVPTHEAELQTYLRMSGIPVGQIFNFNVSRLIDSLRRFMV